MIPYRCSTCGKSYQLPDERAGLTAKCSCGAKGVVAKPSPDAPNEDNWQSVPATIPPANIAVMPAPKRQRWPIIAMLLFVPLAAGLGAWGMKWHQDANPPKPVVVEVPAKSNQREPDENTGRAAKGASVTPPDRDERLEYYPLCIAWFEEAEKLCDFMITVPASREYAARVDALEKNVPVPKTGAAIMIRQQKAMIDSTLNDLRNETKSLVMIEDIRSGKVSYLKEDGERDNVVSLAKTRKSRMIREQIAYRDAIEKLKAAK